MSYHRARWYDPQTNRFISRDALRSNNRYSYADSAPTTLVDVSGLEPQAAPTPGPAPYNNGYPIYPGSGVTHGQSFGNGNGSFLDDLLNNPDFFFIAAPLAWPLLDAEAGAAVYVTAGRLLSPISRGLAGLLAGRAAANACPTITGPYGSTTAQALQRLAQAGGPTVRLITNQTRSPLNWPATRGLSTAIGENAEALAAGAKGANQYVMNVPSALLSELQRIGLAVQTTTNYGGVTGAEMRLLPQAVPYVTPFLQK